jgi:predicted DNA-binding transcriptional regulator YafY
MSSVENTPANPFEDTLRAAGRENRRVLVVFESTPGTVAERELEPYAIEDQTLIAFSYLRDEFRTLRLSDIRAVEVTSRTFEPRRPVEL